MFEIEEMVRLVQEMGAELDQSLEILTVQELSNPAGTLSTARHIAGQRVGINMLGNNLINKLREGQDNG